MSICACRATRHPETESGSAPAAPIPPRTGTSLFSSAGQRSGCRETTNGRTPPMWRGPAVSCRGSGARGVFLVEVVVILIVVDVVLVVFVARLDVRVGVAGVRGRGGETGDGLVALARFAQEG